MNAFLLQCIIVATIIVLYITVGVVIAIASAQLSPWLLLLFIPYAIVGITVLLYDIF